MSPRASHLPARDFIPLDKELLDLLDGLEPGCINQAPMVDEEWIPDEITAFQMGRYYSEVC